MLVEGLIPTALIGMLGAAVLEAIHIATVLKADRRPSRNALLGAAILVCLGALIVLYGTDRQLAIKVATAGAGFPAVFSGGVAALTAQPATRNDGRRLGPSSRSSPSAKLTLTDWIAWRY